MLKRFFNQVKLITGVEITENDLQNFKYSKLLNGKDITEDKFKELCSDDNLPIIARNVLDNGESKNLWYEQVVPAEAVFYTLIDDKGDGTLANKIGTEKTLVQIGADATIGYGYCEFKNLK